MKETNEKDFYKEKIVEMVEGIEDEELLESVYWFARTIFGKPDK